jgi:cellulose synthase operon protein C
MTPFWNPPPFGKTPFRCLACIASSTLSARSRRLAMELAASQNDVLLTSPLPAKDYTALAQAYVTAVGHGPADNGLARISELFQKMDPARITNSFTTCKFYSRFHLNLVEETVLAVISDDFALGSAGRRWLDEDEQLVRSRIHRDMRQHLQSDKHLMNS